MSDKLDVKGDLSGLAAQGAGFVFAADGDDARGAMGVGKLQTVVDQLEAVHHRHAQIGQKHIKSLGQQL